MPTQRIIFPVAPHPLVVFIAFVSGDIDHRLDATCCADGLQHMHCSHHVGRIGGDRVLIRVAHQRLRCHVNDDFWLVFGKCALYCAQVTYVAQHAGHALPYVCSVKQARRGGRGQRVASDLRAHGLKP